MLARNFSLATLLFAQFALAQSPTAETNKTQASSVLKNETELSEVLVSGNADSQSTSLKEKTSYAFGLNTLIGSGRYLATQTNGLTSARAWDATLRYEKALSTYWSIYASQGAESDIFAGFVQRDNTDLGGKYYFIKRDDQEFIGEAGYRYTHTYAVPSDNRYENFGRLFSQYLEKFTKTSEGKIWVEYLPNLTHSTAYLLNAEPSVTVALSDVFSMKTSYLLKYQGEIPAGFTKHLDSVFSTALVANW